MNFADIAAAISVVGFFGVVIQRTLDMVFPNGFPIKSQLPLMMYVSMLLGIALALIFGIDLVAPVVGELGTGNELLKGIAGQVITGIVMGGGSNFADSIFDSAHAKKQTRELHNADLRDANLFAAQNVPVGDGGPGVPLMVIDQERDPLRPQG